MRRQFAEILSGRHAAHKKSEFIPTEPPDDGIFRKRSLKTPCDEAQHEIASKMTVEIVDRLEAIEIDYRQYPSLPVQETRFDVPDEGVSIANPGQSVVFRAVLRAASRLDQFEIGSLRLRQRLVGIELRAEQIEPRLMAEFRELERYDGERRNRHGYGDSANRKQLRIG